MPFPGGTYLSQIRALGYKVAEEFDQLYALFEGWLRKEHKEDGSHGALTADSITTTVNTATGATGTGTFGADVIAQSGGTTTAAHLGAVSALSTTLAGTSVTSGLHLGGTKGWVMGLRQAGSPGTNTDYELRLFDLNHLAASISALRLFYYTANSWWTLGIETGGALALGENATGKRLSEVNTIALTASSTATVSQLALSSRLIPSSLAADVNDYAINTASRVFQDCTAARNITGIVAGTEGQVLQLVNISTFTLTLKYNSGSSASGNKILGANGADTVIRPNNGSVLLIYNNPPSGFWYVVGA